MTDWNVREAWVEARDKYFIPRSTDPTFTAVQQAQCGEAANACDRAINALDVNDQWPTGQRQARWADIMDKAWALDQAERLHGQGNPGLLYNGIDLMTDAAQRALRGEVIFTSSVDPLP